ncbi:MAG: hypothetical protein AB7T86_04715 [Xanthobacteraceae bacterium]|uniref:hypothetical protein n=1 Tax=Pseudolabrys sp. TaxID=1960880 RepID=UPI003D13400B
MKKTIIAVTAAAFLLTGTSLASAQLCIVGIFAAAAIVGAKEKRELTTKEARSCGLLLGQDKEGEAKLAKKKTAKKVARKPAAKRKSQ